MTQILIIDDDPSIQILLKRTLTRSGYETIVASNGEEGIAKAYDFHPNLIICDWLMPKIDGLEVCRRLKSSPEFATTFFILLTALDSVEDRVQGLDAGADDFLGKPIEMNELKARVRAGLRINQLTYDLKAQKELLEAELAEAADYVRSILPEPLIHPSIEIDFRFLPSRQLGGDCFDYYWLDDEHLVIYLLDVSGHGLRAALPSLSIVHLLRSQSLGPVNYYRPNAVLEKLNQTFQITQQNDKYFTIWYGVYDCANHQLVYASAGHPPAILFTKTNTQEITIQSLSSGGLPLGMFSDVQYKELICDVYAGFSLYLFSDGIYEIEETKGKILGLEEFTRCLLNYHGMANNLEPLIASVQSLSISQHFNDDVSIMKIDFK